jgi:hypothetical protein
MTADDSLRDRRQVRAAELVLQTLAEEISRWFDRTQRAAS